MYRNNYHSFLFHSTSKGLQLKRMISAPVLILTARASNTGIIPIGHGTYMVSRQAATGFSGSGTLKAEAFQEKNAYCIGQNKLLHVVNATEAQPPFILGNYPKAEIQFMCLMAGERELGSLRSSLRLPCPSR